MASVTKLIKDFARSPKGQQLIEQAKEQANKPENRRKLEGLRRRRQAAVASCSMSADAPGVRSTPGAAGRPL